MFTIGDIAITTGIGVGPVGLGVGITIIGIIGVGVTGIIGGERLRSLAVRSDLSVGKTCTQKVSRLVSAVFVHTYTLLVARSAVQRHSR
jgi:hypothetical protein